MGLIEEEMRTADYWTDKQYPTDTFKTLNKDIMIAKNETDNRYDRVIQSGDFVQITEQDSLEQAIKIKLLTRFNEMNLIPTYADWGNKAWFALKSNNTLLTREEINGWVRECVSSIRRVKRVDTVYLRNEITDPAKSIQKLLIQITGQSMVDTPINLIMEAVTYGF